MLTTDRGKKLQEMLKALYIFCDEWGLEINNAIFVVIHFRPPSHTRSQYNLKCGNENRHIREGYKYLGIELSKKCLNVPRIWAP